MVARDHGGLATRRLLCAQGLSNDDIRTEIDAGRWTRLGTHTVGVLQQRPEGEGRFWWAVWESGSSAVLDGVTSLIAAGLTGWVEDVVHICVPGSCRPHRLDGVRLHRPRHVGPTVTAGLPRTRPDLAVVRAAQWAATDRQAATLLAMTVQQRLVPTTRLLEQWQLVRKSPRRDVLDAVIRDVCDGAHSLGELDFAALCRARGLPVPTRQAVRTGRRGRIYLDVHWEELGLHVEVEGIHHVLGAAPVDDALRQNALAIGSNVSLRIPVLGLRLCADEFLDQVEAAIAAARRRRA